MNHKSIGLAQALVCTLALSLSTDAQNTPGEVLSQAKMSSSTFPLPTVLRDEGQFGGALANIGDLDGNGAPDLAVGAPGDDDGGNSRGAVWIVFMEADGTSLLAQKISNLDGNFGATLDDLDRFGASLAPLGDIDGDGLIELAVGAPGDDDGASSAGAVYVLSLDVDGTVDSFQKISALSGGFSGGLDSQDSFGSSLAAIGDLSGDGISELVSGAPGDDDGGSSRGSAWVLFLDSSAVVTDFQKISSVVGSFTGMLDDFDQFGNSLAAPGDIDGDGVEDVVVGAFGDDDGGPSHGAVWILFLNPQGTVDSFTKISSTSGNFGGTIDNGDAFGVSVASLSDIDGNGVSDLGIGVLRDDDGGGPSRGAVWICYMDSAGAVRGQVKISQTSGGFTGSLADFDQFGSAITGIGDLDGDGNEDIVVGALNDDDGGTDRGAFYTLFLEGAFQAAVVDRPSNNISCMTNGNTPRIGNSWLVLRDSGPSMGDTYLIGQMQPFPSPIVFPFGELVVDITSPTVFVDQLPGGPGMPNSHNLPVPNDAMFAGVVIYVQGLRVGPPLELCNAFDVTLGF